jgi:hypothetical protein
MTTDATIHRQRLGKINPGMEGFKITGTIKTIGDGLVLESNGTGIGLEIFPH